MVANALMLQSLRIERFKRIRDAPFDLEPLNVLVGANNSGKSSIIQGLHFAIATLQTMGLLRRFQPSSVRPLSTSLGPNELIYSPSENAYALGFGGMLKENKAEAIAVTFVLQTGEKCSIRIRKGRNRNVLVSVEHPQTAQKLSGLRQPFSIFSPGLAGIVKTESHVSDGVLLRTLARGDANLVLRNILLRLWGTTEWEPFLQDLHTMFPGSDIKVNWEPETDEFINVQIKIYDSWVCPLSWQEQEFSRLPKFFPIFIGSTQVWLYSTSPTRTCTQTTNACSVRDATAPPASGKKPRSVTPHCRRAFHSDNPDDSLQTRR